MPSLTAIRFDATGPVVEGAGTAQGSVTPTALPATRGRGSPTELVLQSGRVAYPVAAAAAGAIVRVAPEDPASPLGAARVDRLSVLGDLRRPTSSTR